MVGGGNTTDSNEKRHLHGINCRSENIFSVPGFQYVWCSSSSAAANTRGKKNFSLTRATSYYPLPSSLSSAIMYSWYIWWKMYEMKTGLLANAPLPPIYLSSSAAPFAHASDHHFWLNRTNNDDEAQQQHQNSFVLLCRAVLPLPSCRHFVPRLVGFFFLLYFRLPLPFCVI